MKILNHLSKLWASRVWRNIILFLAVFCLLYVLQILEKFKFIHIPNLDLANIFILTIGFIGLFNWIYVICLSTSDRSQFDRSLANANGKRLAYILLLVVSIPCILYLGYFFIPIELSSISSFDRFIEVIVNPFLNHGGFDKDNGITPSLISLLGTFFLSGVLVSMLVSFLNQRSEKWEKGELRYTFKKCTYCVVIGAHDAVPSLVRQLVSKYDKVIVFTNKDIPSFRIEVESFIEQEPQKQKVVFYKGYRNSKSDLQLLNLDRDNLKAIYVLGEGRVQEKEEMSHDSLNMTCFSYVKELRGANKPVIDCYVFFENQMTSIIFQKYTKENQGNTLNFIPYNFYELQAQKAIGWRLPMKGTGCQERGIQYPVVELDRFDRSNVNEDKHVHLVVIGMSRMGQALGLEALRVCHYPNYAKSQMLFEYGFDDSAQEMMQKRRTRITFVDCNMQRELETFKCRYRRLLEEVSWTYCDYECSLNSQYHPMKQDNEKTNPDVELEFIHGYVQSEKVSEYLESISNDSSAVMTVASCLSQSNQSLSTILCLPKDVLEKAEILVYQADSTELVNNIAIGNNNIKAFGMTAQAVNIKHLEMLESMAKRINYVYANSGKLKDDIKKNLESDNESPLEAIKDVWRKFRDGANHEECESQWRALPETWRWANRYHASAIWQKLHYIHEDVEKLVIDGISKDDGRVQDDFEGWMVRVEHNRYCIEQWLLDRKPSTDDAFKCYRCLKQKDSPYVVFPTNDQIMTMAIPYIVGDYNRTN